MTPSAKLEQALEEMRADFIETAHERLDDLEARVFSSAPATEELPLDIFREVHSLKGSGATFGLQSVSLIAHQFEDYLSASPPIDDRFIEDTAKFIDALRSVVTRNEDPGTDTLSKVLRGLPVRHEVELDVESPPEVEILLVSPSRSARHILARDLRACGYRVVSVDSPWKALQMSVCTQPDMVITSVVMDGMNGVDLANALRAIEPTQHIPVAVVTSFDLDHPVLKRLTPDTPVIRSGTHFQSDLADALTAASIT